MFNSWLLYLYCYPFTFPYKNLSDKWLWDTFYQIKTIDVKYFNAKLIKIYSDCTNSLLFYDTYNNL